MTQIMPAYSPGSVARRVAKRQLKRRKTTAEPVPFIPLPDWMAQHRAYLGPGRPFDLAGHPYLVDIYADEADQVDFMKAGQMGISEYLISWVVWSADRRGATGLYVFPNDGVVSDFSAGRLGPAIEPAVSPYLAGVIQGAKGGQRGADRVTLKRVRDRFIYFRGGTVKADGRAPQLHSVDADVLVLDEYDEMDQRAPAIAEERLGHSQIAQVRRCSTPTYAGAGIHARYQASDQRQWLVRCEGCGGWQDLQLGDLVIEADDLGRPVAWHTDGEGRPYLACRRCGGVMDRLGPGEWVARYPERAVHGYHLSRLFAGHKPLSDLLAGLQTTNETKRQQTYNQGLGLPYTPSSAVSLTDPVLDRCRRDYALGPEEKPGKVCAGVDVGRVLHVVIRETLATTGERRARFIGDLPDFEEVGRVFRQYHVGQAVIDALPETRAARQFQDRFRAARIWLAYYDLRSKAASWVDWDYEAGQVHLDRTRSLDDLMDRFGQAAEGEGGCTLPGNARELPDYYDHLKALSRQFRTGRDGNRVAVYLESGPDHFAHAENYCNVAFAAAAGVFFG